MATAGSTNYDLNRAKGGSSYTHGGTRPTSFLDGGGEGETAFLEKVF